MPKVSGSIRKYSRLAETIDGDWFDHHCRPTKAVFFGLISFLTKADQFAV